MRRNQYSSAKRRKELDRKKKQEEKRQRKLDRRNQKSESDLEPGGAGQTADSPLTPPAQDPEAGSRG